MANIRYIYDPNLDIWPDLRNGRVVLLPSRVGVDRKTGKMLIGWDHVLQSMQVIFSTRYHERVMRQWVGSMVPHLLGESMVPRMLARFYWAIISAIDLWEPCYSVQRVNVQIGSQDQQLSSIEEIRTGKLTTEMIGVYRPRGHLGDDTPDDKRIVGIIGSEYHTWDLRTHL